MAVSRSRLESFEGFVFLLNVTPIGELILSYSHSLETVFALQCIFKKYGSTFQGLTLLQAELDRRCAAVFMASSRLAKKHEVGPTCHLCPSTETHPEHYSLHLGTAQKRHRDEGCVKCRIGSFNQNMARTGAMARLRRYLYREAKRPRSG